MPRIGMAYSPGTSGRTSIRAGFGMFYDVLYDNQGLLTLPPQANHTVDVTGLNQERLPGRRRHSAELQRRGVEPGGSARQTGGYVPDQIRPETISWNIGVQHVF